MKYVPKVKYKEAQHMVNFHTAVSGSVLLAVVKGYKYLFEWRGAC
jgi:hypothetical protein